MSKTTSWQNMDIGKLRILFIEDSQDDYELLLLELKKANIKSTTRRIEIKEELKREVAGKFNWDLVISDNRLPNLDAQEALDMLRNAGIDIPFIIVSGTIGEEAAVEAMLNGASDYILKDNLARLVPAIRREVTKYKTQSKRRHLEKELKRVERNYRLLAENVQDLVCVHGPSGKYLWVSPSSKNILGYSPRELIEFGPFFDIHPKDAEMVRSKTFQNEKNNITRLNYRRKRKDGVYVFLETLSEPVFEEGKLIRWVSTSRDISERVMAYSLIEENEIRLAGILESLSEGIILIDDKGAVMSYNKSAQAILNIDTSHRSIHDIMKAIPSIVNYDLKPIKYDQLPFLKTLSTGQSLFNEILGLESNGLKWLSMNAVPYVLSDFKHGVVISVNDVTDYINQQAKMNRLATEQLALIENANAPIFGIDWTGKITEWNAYTTKITGYSKEEVQGTNLIDKFIISDHKNPVRELFKRVLRGKSATNYELPILTKDKKLVTILFNGTSRRDYTGKIVGLIGVGQDITELIEYRHRLEQKVQERTNELTKTLKKEKDLVAIKSKFVSMASHEFRTPLSTIQFANDFISKYYKRAGDEKLREKFAKINDQIRHMTYLLDDVLTIGKSQAGAIKASPSPVEVREFMKEIFEEVQNSAGNTHSILSSIAIDSRVISTDKKLLRNIAVNLLSNAVKFSPEQNEVKAEIRCEKNWLSLTVQDWGGGIDPSEKDKIFEAFHRGSNVENISGTGLGLSIVKKAVEVLKGSINVESELGKGSKFTVQLPVKYHEKNFVH